MTGTIRGTQETVVNKRDLSTDDLVGTAAENKEANEK